MRIKVSAKRGAKEHISKDFNFQVSKKKIRKMNRLTIEEDLIICYSLETVF